ncbi:MAG TPA: class I SAM-dependent methyltransferase, partial [Nitrospiria bacterium]
MTERVDNLDVTVRRADGWPYEGSRFDLVVLPDFGCDWGWRADLNATLRESHRVLVSGGCLYMTADNKLRRRSHGLNLATAGRRLRRTGFGATRWFAAFPSASLPKHLVDLHGNGVMDYYVSVYLNLGLRSGPMIRQANRFACRLGMASYLVPGYAMLGRKESE